MLLAELEIYLLVDFYFILHILTFDKNQYKQTN